MLVSVIIPCYNEEEVILTTITRLNTVMQGSGFDYELIYVNDGSRDKTLSLLREKASSDKKIKVLTFSRNFGHQPAVTAGLRNCKGDVAVIIDADLQDPPEVVPEMIRLLVNEKANVVYGVRNKRSGESFFKKITAKLFYRFLNRLSDHKIPNDTGDFRVIDRKMIDAFCKLEERNMYIRGLIAWAGFKQLPFSYKREARFEGETKYTFVKMLKFASVGIMSFSKKPLRLSFILGLFCVLLGIGYAIFVILAKIFHFAQLEAGWTSLIIAVIFFGGVQMLMIGILGEYMGVIFDEVKKRPDYIIDERINLD